MKKFLIHAGKILLASMLMITICSTTCNDDDDEPDEPDKCGPVDQVLCDWFSDHTLDPASYFLYIEDTYAVYEYATDLVEDVCAHNHIVGQIDISINKNYSSIFFYECEVVYGVLFTYPLMDWNSHELDEDNIVYTSIFEFGMKNVYGDDPGWFMPIVRINIKNQGSEEENHALMESTMNRIRIQCQYYKWKDNSGS